MDPIKFGIAVIALFSLGFLFGILIGKLSGPFKNDPKWKSTNEE